MFGYDWVMLETARKAARRIMTPAARLEGLSLEARSRRVYLPALEPFPRETWPLVSMLPVVDINGALVEALARRAPFRAAPPVAGIFACDPFLRPIDLASALARAGIQQAVNLPTVQIFDGETAAVLASVGYRAEAEFRLLLRLAEYGIAPIACATTRATADLALELGFTRILLHPGLVPPRDPSAWWTSLAGHVAIEGAEPLAWQETDADQGSKPRRLMRL